MSLVKKIYPFLILNALPFLFFLFKKTDSEIAD